MQAHAEPRRNTRLRAAAALITCILALTSVTAAAHSRGHKHVSRAGAVLANSAGLSVHATPRPDLQATTGTTPSLVAALIAWPATADSSTVARSRRVKSPSVRGPPAPALA